MIKSPSAIELNVFQGKTPEKCGAKSFVKTVNKGDLFCFHRHNFIELEYVESGGLKHEVCGEKSTVGEGEFYALGTEHFHKVEFTETSSICALTLFPRLLPASLQKLVSKFSFPIAGKLPYYKRHDISIWFRRIRCLLFHDEPGGEEKVNGYLLLILSTFLEHSYPIIKKKASGRYKHITEATEYIQEHYKEDISLDDIARAVYLSPNHLSKIFTEANGMSISQYLIEYRLEMARYYLSSTDKSITEIALECGFGSFSSFSRSWKRYFGLNPREFKKNFFKD